MLKWITGKLARTDDSPASEAGLREFLESLPTSKPALALRDIGERFASDAELQLINPATCRRALLRLDEAAQGPLEETWNELFGDSLGKSISDGPWRALVNYQRSLYSGYALSLGKLPPPAKLDAKERQDALILANRAMAGLIAHKALMRIRYRDPYPEFWTDAHALHARALQYGVAQTPVKLYPGALRQTTVEREYIAGLLLDVAPTGNLLPTQIQCLSLILQRFNEFYRLFETSGAQAPFFIDPANSKPPQRLLEGFKPRPGMRYFGFGAAYKHLGALRTAVDTDPAPPEWVQNSCIDADRYRALLDTLMEHWSQNPPQRRNRRDRHAATIFVTQGLSQAYRMLAYSKFAKEGRQINYSENTSKFNARFGSVNENTPSATPDQVLTPMDWLHKFELAGDREVTEQWSVIDMSEGGLGVVAEKHRGWLRAGILVGYRYHDNIDWRIAIVRRVGRTPQGSFGAGLKIQEETADCVRLRLHKVNETDSWIAAGTGTDPYADAILVGGEKPMLLVPSGTYSPQGECQMKIEKSTQQIRFDKLLESGVDFERVSFTLSEKS